MRPRRRQRGTLLPCLYEATLSPSRAHQPPRKPPSSLPNLSIELERPFCSTITAMAAAATLPCWLKPEPLSHFLLHQSTYQTMAELPR